MSCYLMSIITCIIYNYDTKKNIKKLDQDQFLELEHIDFEIGVHFSNILNGLKVFINRCSKGLFVI